MAALGQPQGIYSICISSSAPGHMQEKFFKIIIFKEISSYESLRLKVFSQVKDFVLEVRMSLKSFCVLPMFCVQNLLKIKKAVVYAEFISQFFPRTLPVLREGSHSQSLGGGYCSF